MKRYWLFLFSHDCPKGGLNDAHSTYTHVAEAFDVLSKLIESKEYGNPAIEDHAQVIDLLTWKSGKYNLTGKNMIEDEVQLTKESAKLAHLELFTS